MKNYRWIYPSVIFNGRKISKKLLAKIALPTYFCLSVNVNFSMEASGN